MTYLDKEKQRASQRESYLRNKEKAIASAKTSRQKRIDVVNQAKSKPCNDCGILYPYQVMDLHHRDGNDKNDDVSRLVRSASMATLVAEIEKCDVLCSNCHRIRHI